MFAAFCNCELAEDALDFVEQPICVARIDTIGEGVD